MEANKAMAPRKVMYDGWSSPVITIEPTTAMAEIAFVSDISGVCSNRKAAAGAAATQAAKPDERMYVRIFRSLSVCTA